MGSTIIDGFIASSATFLFLGGQEKLIKERMKKFNEEISHWNEYNYIVVNDDLETCYNKILFDLHNY